MPKEFDTNQVLSKKERQECVLDLHFNQNKNYRQIAQEMKMSLRDIGEIVNRAKEEKERQEHKSLAVQAYDKFSKDKTPLQVAIDLNIGQAQASHYHWEYLKLIGLEDITKIYLEFKGDVSYFVSLCKAVKEAKMGIPQVVNLLRVANNHLPLVEHRYQELQKQNNTLESNLSIAAKEFQNLTNHISFMGNRLDKLNSECELETGTLQYLRQQVAKMEAFVHNYKNNDQEYNKLRKSIEDEVHALLSNKKRFLDLAIFSVIYSMRNSPDKYSSLVYNNNEKSSKDSSHS